MRETKVDIAKEDWNLGAIKQWNLETMGFGWFPLGLIYHSYEIHENIRRIG